MAITMQDVAREAGVSVATVSHVLAKRWDVPVRAATRERVLTAARRLNYQYNALAAGLRRGATRMVGIQLYSPELPALVRKIAVMEEVLREAGLYPFLGHVMDAGAEQQFFTLCAVQRVSGIVLTVPPRPENEPLVSRLMAEGAVVVSFEEVAHLPVPTVAVDRAGAVAMSVRHLYDLGRRRIAALCGYQHDLPRRQFHAAYQHTVTELALPRDAAAILDFDATVPFAAACEQAVARLLDRPEPPTAIIVTEEKIAMGVQCALRHRGRRVPDDIALLGWNGTEMSAYVDPPLTTLIHPAEAMGRRLGELFLTGLKDPTQIVGSRTTLPMELLVRASCGAGQPPRED
jgi:LacI family transcriptional regulator, repressor for deo operon, udp, cdd, tsx, nupC, and nupG